MAFSMALPPLRYKNQLLPVAIEARLRRGQTFSQIGKEAGVTRERIRQVAHKAGLDARRRQLQHGWQQQKLRERCTPTQTQVLAHFTKIGIPSVVRMSARTSHPTLHVAGHRLVVQSLYQPREFSSGYWYQIARVFSTPLKIVATSRGLLPCRHPGPGVRARTLYVPFCVPWYPGKTPSEARLAYTKEIRRSHSWFWSTPPLEHWSGEDLLLWITSDGTIPSQLPLPEEPIHLKYSL